MNEAKKLLSDSPTDSFFFKVGQKRAFGLIMAAFKAYNNIADFMASTGDVVEWFDNINGFMESGGTEGGDQITTESLEELKNEIKSLAEDVESKHFMLL